MPEDITGIILAGGKSTRMGVSKALIQVEGTPIIRRIQTLFERLFNETIIVTNQKESFLDLGAKVYDDLIPDRGVLGGLYTGLFFSSFRFSFCVACDMPFLNESLVKYLVQKIEGYDVIVPRTEDGLQPLHAIYSKDCLKAMSKLLGERKYKIVDFYPMVRVKIVEEADFLSLDPMRESFINVNTPEELTLIRKRKQLA